jgi:Zn-dependent protease
VQEGNPQGFSQNPSGKREKSMFPSWKIARFFGINVFIHWTFWLLPAWVILTHSDNVENLGLGMHLLLLGALFVCVVMHEFGHALTARHFGIGTRSITLTPLGGVAQLERMSHQPWEEFCIAIAGPMVNVVLAMILGTGLLAWYLLLPSLVHTSIYTFFIYLLGLNVLMIVFNLLPAFPMDGGRVLRSILSHVFGLLQGTRIAVGIGATCAILMGFAGVVLLHNPWIPLIAVFVIWAGNRELTALKMEEQERLRMSMEAVPVAFLCLRAIGERVPQRGDRFGIAPKSPSGAIPS